MKRLSYIQEVRCQKVKIYIKIVPTCFGYTTIIREPTVCALLKLYLLNSQLKYVVMESVRPCGCISIQSLLVCVQCTVHMETVLCADGIRKIRDHFVRLNEK